MQVTASEMNGVVSAYNDKSPVKKVQSDGLYIGGERYVVLKADDRSLYGKKVGDANKGLKIPLLRD